jgi:hypothetical protein
VTSPDYSLETASPAPGSRLSPNPYEFGDRIDNPWLPLRPGSQWVYETTVGDRQRITVTVTDQTREVAGVTATVVHDVVRAPDGTVVEDSYDWFAQDVDGNVWYLGEDTTEYDARGRADTEGSWEAGVDGAEAGLAMAAHPGVGDAYQQEHLEGVAEDRAEVLSLDEQRTVPFGELDGLLQTEETSPLEPDVVEHKYYARGVGTVLEETVAGGAERVELVSFTAG